MGYQQKASSLRWLAQEWVPPFSVTEGRDLGLPYVTQTPVTLVCPDWWQVSARVTHWWALGKIQPPAWDYLGH